MGIKYSRLKMFHFPEKMASLPADAPIQPPLHIRLKPTNRCNHNCRYCAYRNDSLQLGRDMKIADTLPREKFLEIARDLVEMKVKAVTFSGGGEPLLHPNLLEAANIMADGGIKLACLTNGSPLGNETAEFFSQNATWLRVSMDGWSNDSYARYRGTGPNEFDKIMNNLAAFSRLGGPCALGASYIVDGENYEKIPQMLARYKDMGLASVKVSPCVFSDDPAINNARHQPYFQAAQELIEESITRLTDKNFEIQNAWHTLSANYEKNYHWCPSAQLVPVIGADAVVYPCHDKAYNNQAALGNLEKQSFQKFWMRAKNTLIAIDPVRDCRHHCAVNFHNQMAVEFLDIDQEHGCFV